VQFESWDDAVKKARAKAEEEATSEEDSDAAVVPRPLASGSSTRRKVIAALLWIGFGFGLGITTYRWSSRTAELIPLPLEPVHDAHSQPGHGSRTAELVPLPLEQRYRVMKTEGSMAQDTVYVRLASKCDESGLRSIARSVHDKWTTGKPLMYFFFYLHELDKQPRGAAPALDPWAFGRFESPSKGPELIIDIRGSTAAEEAKLIAGATVPPDAVVLGRWFLDSNLPTLYTIFRRDGSFFLREHDRTGSGTDQELVPDRSPELRRFRTKPPSESHDFYVITNQDDLEMRSYDVVDLVFLAKRVP
jgi:hypothetical protein